MAGKIKKGFTTYLFILFFALLAAFLICVTIMLFSPFKSVLGFKYFFYEDEKYEYNITGAETGNFDFSTLSTIKVNCGYANVNVSRDFVVEKDAIKIENKVKGFAKDSQNSNFSYNISYEDALKKVLNIEVNEPEGFLFLSKNITINIIIPIGVDWYDFSDTKIDVVNTSGTLYIGNAKKITTEGSNEINVNQINFQTNTGKLKVNSFCNHVFNNIFITSLRGSVEFDEDIDIRNGILEVHSKSARLKFKNIKETDDSDIILDLGDSKFYSPIIRGDIVLSLESGYFDVDEMHGNVIANNANTPMKSGSITIKKVMGVLSFPCLNGTRLTIGTILGGTSTLYAHSTSGNITVQELRCMAYIETTSGSVNILTKKNDFDIKTKSGNINVIYNTNDIADQLDLYTESGTINLKVKSELAYTLMVYDVNGQLRNNGITLDWFKGKVPNPIIVNEGTKVINVISNGRVNLSLIDVE